MEPATPGATPAAPAAAHPWRDLVEYRMLARASTFECAAVSEGGDTPLSAVAFARLVLRDDAALVFEDLLEQPSLVARIYGEKGMWFTDRGRYLRDVEAMGRLQAMVPTFCGCIREEQPVRDILAASPARNDLQGMAGPVDLFRRGVAWLEAADPRDGSVAHWRSTLLDEKDAEQRLWAARALAYSLDGPGLETLLACLPQLDGELRARIADLLRQVPPWSRGTVKAVASALRSKDTLVQYGALRALLALQAYPRLRVEARALVPRLEQILTSYTPDRQQPDEEDFRLTLLLADLRAIGGPAGPVLARALGHREKVVRENVSIDLANLDSWVDGTIAEIQSVLDRSDSTGRARVIRALCGSLGGVAEARETSPVAPAVTSAIEKLVPILRKAAATLEGPERTDLEKEIDEALGAPAVEPTGREE